jgi:putative iron-dependent peroxidase
MHTAQAGIFALGTSSHVYLEFDLADEKQCRNLAAAVAAIREPRTTTGGVNFVIGFRPELWREMVPDQTPAGIEGFNKNIEGVEAFVKAAPMTWCSIWQGW